MTMTATPAPPRDRLRAAAVVLYGVLAYLAFLASFGAFIAWFGGISVPQAGPLGLPAAAALAVDAGLLLLFGGTHSVMARPWFKRRWTRVVPEHAERSTYVLVASITLGLLVWGWQPLGGTVWEASGGARLAAHGLYLAAVGLVLWVSLVLNHFDVTGLRQSWYGARRLPYQPIPLRTRSLYRVARHPMNVGLLAMAWAVPTMTGGRLAAAIGVTAYILVGQTLEERDLKATHAEAYRQYAREVPALGLRAPR